MWSRAPWPRMRLASWPALAIYTLAWLAGRAWRALTRHLLWERRP